MSKQAMNQLLGTLERAGYIVRRRHPTYRKQRLVELTARGWRAIAIIRAAVDDIEHDLECRLGSRRYRTLLACLREIATAR
jgi:DNA-binding MarR family transcriptional regulator